ncbi:4518_t:CDS:10, partial [Racocetra persica]
MSDDNCNDCGEPFDLYKCCIQCVRKQDNDNCEVCNGSLEQFKWYIQCGCKLVMEGWTSGNAKYDKIIKETQEGIDWHGYPCLKWIPEEHLKNIIEIGKYKFGTFLSADWVNGDYDSFQIDRNGILVYKYKSKKCRIKVFNKDDDFLADLQKGKSYLLELDDKSRDYKCRLYGVSQLKEMGKYVLICGAICMECGSIFKDCCPWCTECHYERKQLTLGWTSGRSEYDEIIRKTQEDADWVGYECLKWIPTSSLKNLALIQNNSTGIFYSADLVDGEYDTVNYDENLQIMHHWKMVKVTVKYALIAGTFCAYCGGLLDWNAWCAKCDLKRLMEGWTSGNEEYDTIIQETQKEAYWHGYRCLKWIPTESLENLKKIRTTWQGIIYTADWIDGGYIGWEIGQNQQVIIKRTTIRAVVRTKQYDYDSDMEYRLALIKQGELEADTDFLQELKKHAETVQKEDNKNWWGPRGITYLNDRNEYAFVEILEWGLPPVGCIIEMGFIIPLDYPKDYGTCKECSQPNTYNNGDSRPWCHPCNAQHGDRESDEDYYNLAVILKKLHKSQNISTEFITELSAHVNCSNKYYKPSSFDSFVRCIGLSKDPTSMEYVIVLSLIYEMKESISPVIYGDCKECGQSGGYSWCKLCNSRHFQDQQYVALKKLHNSQNISEEYLNEIAKHIDCNSSDKSQVVRCFGISQDPGTKEYTIVLEFCDEGDLRTFIHNNSDTINWITRLSRLYNIATGLYKIHLAGLVHRDFHSGNLFLTRWNALIGELPHSQRAHDTNLALEIYNGIRPQVFDAIPPCYAEMMQQCWDADPSKRPTAEKLATRLRQWCYGWDKPIDFYQQMQAAELRKSELAIGKKTRSLTNYTSKRLPIIKNVKENEVLNVNDDQILDSKLQNLSLFFAET